MIVEVVGGRQLRVVLKPGVDGSVDAEWCIRCIRIEFMEALL